jgi:hypothetical protein
MERTCNSGRAPHEQDSRDQTVSVAEAGRRLGISQRVVRERAASGALRARRVRTPHSVEWQIFVGGLPDPPRPTRWPRPEAESGAAGPEILQLVTQLQQRTIDLAQENGRLKAELEWCRATIRTLQGPFGERGRVG